MNSTVLLGPANQKVSKMSEEEADRLSAALSRARKAADNLGPTTDQLTETIAKIERALTEQRFGVTASVALKSEARVDEDGNDFGAELTLLAFRKEGKNWKLMIESGVVGDEPDAWHSMPLLSASRELRLLAVDHMHELVDGLADRAEEQVEEVERRRAKAEALLAKLQTPRSKGGEP